MKITKRLVLKMAALALMSGAAFTIIPQQAFATPGCGGLYYPIYNFCRSQGHSDAYCRVYASNAVRTCLGY